MSGKKSSCFTTDTVVRRDVKFFFISYQRLKTKKYSVRVSLSYSGFSFYEHFNRQFSYAVVLYLYIGLSKTILCQYFVVFLPCLGQLIL